MAPGDRVAIAGGGFANHAEVDIVPSLLCAQVPQGVDRGARGVRDARRDRDQRVSPRRGPRSGPPSRWSGLGLIGQLAVRVARAAGCGSWASTCKPEPLELAARAGAEAMLRSELDGGSALGGSGRRGLGLRGERESNDPVHFWRRVWRAIAHRSWSSSGDVEMDCRGRPSTRRSSTFASRAPTARGGTTPNYELHGLDYPIGYVRWTEQRNMAAFLESGRRGEAPALELITHRFPFADAERAFEALESEETAGRRRAALWRGPSGRRPATERATARRRRGSGTAATRPDRGGRIRHRDR